MSDRLRILLTIFVLVLFFVALRMIRRQKLNLSYSLLWLFLSFLVLLAVIFPETIYGLAALIGIELPLNMLLVFFAFFSLIMMFYLTVMVSRQNDRARKLTQKLALLEKRVRALEEAADRKE